MRLGGGSGSGDGCLLCWHGVGVRRDAPFRSAFLYVRCLGPFPPSFRSTRDLSKRRFRLHPFPLFPPPQIWLDHSGGLRCLSAERSSCGASRRAARCSWGRPGCHALRHAYAPPVRSVAPDARRAQKQNRSARQCVVFIGFPHFIFEPGARRPPVITSDHLYRRIET
jgi:hypothetical protein